MKKLKPYADINTKLREKGKNDFKKGWWVIQFLEKFLEISRKHRNIKLVTTERRRNY